MWNCFTNHGGVAGGADAHASNAAQLPRGLGCSENRQERSDDRGFHDALRMHQTDRVAKREAVARINLPFAVKPDPQRWLCAYEATAAKVLIVRMEGPTSRFARSNMLTTLIAADGPPTTETTS